MKVLFLGVFSPHSTNVSQALALERIGCDVHRIDFRAMDVTSTIIREICESLSPDIVLFSKAAELDTACMDACGKAWKVLWYMDPVNVNWNRRLEEKMERADVAYCNIWQSYERAKTITSNARFLQEGFDPLVDRPIVDRPTEEQGVYDVTFIGSLYGERSKYVPYFKHLKNIYGIEHAKAVSLSKINLNFTSGGASDRAYKILAAGGFLLTQPWPHMEDDFRPGFDFSTFRSETELEQKINYFLAHEYERMRIASNGYLTVQKFNRVAWAKRIVECKLR